jgi:hypothetical protein
MMPRHNSGRDRTLEGVADPALIRLPREAGLGSIDTAGQRELMSLAGMGVDILAVDADRWRADKAKTLRLLVARHVDQAQLRLDVELAADPFHQRASALVAGTTVEVEDLDQRLPHPVILPCENCSPEQQAHSPS